MNKQIIYTSWGYDMTHNDYAMILENTGKTVKVVMIGTKVQDDNGMGNGRSYPNPEVIKSAPFRLRIKGKNSYRPDSNTYSGSYPYCNNSKRSGYFWDYEGQGNYYNTWD